MTRLWLAALGMIAANSATAGDLNLRPALDTEWQGAYVGAQLGYGRANTDYVYATDGDYNTAVDQVAAHNVNGLLGGFHAGYNWQSGWNVYGIEAAAQLSGLDEKIVGPYGPQDRIDTKINWIASVTPRVGMASDNWLIYAKGGIAFADITARNEDVNFGIFDERSDTRTGWTAGLGVERLLTSKLSLGLEGNYYDFGSFGGGEQASRYIAEPNIEAPSSSNHSIDTSIFTISARASYRFGN